MPNRMEQAASKAAGKTKAAKARIRGLEGIFKTLTEEHGEVSALLKRVSLTSDPAVRAELFPTIRKELLAHERGELSELYPLLEDDSSTRGIVRDHDNEARELEALLGSLEEQGYESPRWNQLFDRLVELVQHHTTEEENKYFPKAQEVLGRERAELLNERYLQKKRSVMSEI